jgi:hypothetical protein
MNNAAPLPPLPAIESGLYQHYKGGRYRALSVVRHSETLEPMVLYQPLAGDGTLWVRPWAMFVGQVEVGGVMQDRFARQPD